MRTASPHECRDPRIKGLLPVDAATLILIDRRGPEPQVLMGRRNPALRFMPGKFVFPGGRVDGDDVTLARHLGLPAKLSDRLVAPPRAISGRRAAALALAALRETVEETGFILGQPPRNVTAPPAALPAGFAPFAAEGLLPDPGCLHLLARAITPTGRPRRFDTRFFVADRAQAAAHRPPALGADAELTEVVWVPLARASELDMPMITQVVLTDLAAALREGLSPEAPVPLYRERHGRFRREWIGA